MNCPIVQAAISGRIRRSWRRGAAALPWPKRRCAARRPEPGLYPLSALERAPVRDAHRRHWLALAKPRGACRRLRGRIKLLAFPCRGLPSVNGWRIARLQIPQAMIHFGRQQATGQTPATGYIKFEMRQMRRGGLCRRPAIFVSPHGQAMGSPVDGLRQSSLFFAMLKSNIFCSEPTIASKERLPMRPRFQLSSR